jgi:penicillin amidase
MRPMIVAACLVAASLCGCTTSNPSPSLTITPSEVSSPISQPTVFTAVLVNSTDDVTWTVSAGTLSSSSGLHVTYAPPLGAAMATLTAKAGSLTATVQVPSAPQSKTIPGLTAAVTVQYDAQDIPHIQCAAAADCVAVQGYVHARDRLFPMDFTRHVARSKLAEMIGVDGLSQDVQLRTLFITRDGKRLEVELAKALDASTKTLLTAYAAGVNAYLAELRAGGKLPGEYAQLPFPLTPADIEPWTIEDTLAVGRLNQFQLSESLNAESANGQFAAVYASDLSPLKDLTKVNAWIRAAAPPTEQAHTLSLALPTQRAAVPAAVRRRGPTFDLGPWRNVLLATAQRFDALRDRLRPLDASIGSNNWVVAGEKSATHVSMVANDPHLSLQYPPLFHLATMTSSNASENLDLTGGTFPGVPGALVGRGAHVGWGVTVVGYDVTDVYLEKFETQGCAGPAPCVQFKGAAVSTIQVPETYLVRTGAGAAALVDAKTLPSEALPPQFRPPAGVPAAVLVVPHHGPIIQRDPNDPTKAVSMRWTGHEGTTQDSKAFYGLNTATNVDTAMAALNDYATGAQNFVLADDQGHIAYYPHALVPVRKFADVGVVGAGVKFAPPWFPIPGQGEKVPGTEIFTEWGDGVADCAAPNAGTIAACWIANDKLPQGKDPAKGYFLTANADPTSLPPPNQDKGVSDDNNPLLHPPYLSFDWDDSTGFRATRIKEMLDAAIADHDNVTLDDMQAIQSDHVSRPGKAFEPIIAAIPGSTPPALAAAKAVINQWKLNGFDCPSGLLGSDPKTSPVSTDPKVLQNSAGCFLFHVFLRTLIPRVFTDDLGLAKQGINQLAAIKALLLAFSADPDAAGAALFCNDTSLNAQGVVVVVSHPCIEQVATALVTAYATLAATVGTDPNTWIWGRRHTMRPVSLLALVTNNYQPGPFARPGGAFTVDVGSPSLTGVGLDFPFGSSGNVRHISLMDPAAPKVRMQLPGPERDVPTTALGPDLLGQWVRNTYFDYAAGAQINPIAVSIQTFKAP